MHGAGRARDWQRAACTDADLLQCSHDVNSNVMHDQQRDLRQAHPGTS